MRRQEESAIDRNEDYLVVGDGRYFSQGLIRGTKEGLEIIT